MSIVNPSKFVHLPTMIGLGLKCKSLRSDLDELGFILVVFRLNEWRKSALARVLNFCTLRYFSNTDIIFWLINIYHKEFQFLNWNPEEQTEEEV